jgi:hypothetical protein
MPAVHCLQTFTFAAIGDKRPKILKLEIEPPFAFAIKQAHPTEARSVGQIPQSLFVWWRP